MSETIETTEKPVRQNRSAKVNLFFGEGEFDFKLGIDQLVELQEKLDEGPGVTLARLSGGLHGSWKIETIKDTLRIALVGGGMDKQKAYNIVQRNFVAGYIFESLLIARTIIEIALVGCEEEKPGEQSGETENLAQPNLSQTEKSDGQIIMEPGQ